MNWIYFSIFVQWKKYMRKFFKYLFRILLIIIGLFLLLLVLVYLPPVQRYVKNKAVEYVSKRTGLDVKVDRFSLKFPLRVEIDGAFVGKNGSDTLAYIGQLDLEVGLGGIFRKELAVQNLALEEVKANILNDTTGLQLNIDVRQLSLKVPRVSLGNKTADISVLRLNGGNVFLQTGKKTIEADTIPSKPFDWTFQVARVSMEEVRYRMKSETLPELSAGVGYGTITEGKVGIAGQFVTVEEVVVGEGVCRIRTASQTTVSEETPASSDTTSPWTIQAGKVGIENYAFFMGPETGKGFELNLSDIGIRVDSVYNRGTEIRATLDQLHVVRKEGGRIDSMYAKVALEDTLTEAGHVYIRTPFSELRLHAVADGSLQQLFREVPLRVKMKGYVGMGDVRLFWKEAPEEIRGKRININTALLYAQDKIGIERLSLAMPGNFLVKGEGKFTSLQKLSAVSGSLNLQGDFTDLSFLVPMLKGKIQIPPHISLALDLNARNGHLFPNLRLCEGGGCVSLTGEYGISSESYDLKVKADSFRLMHFLPADSLGMLTAEVDVKGKGWKYGKATAHLTADLQSFEYKRHFYQDIRLAAGLEGRRLTGVLKSGDPDLLADLRFEVDSVDNRYTAELKGRLEKADFKSLHLTPEEFGLSLSLDVKASVEKWQDYVANMLLDSIRIDNGRGYTDLGSLVVHFNSEPGATNLDVVSGDFKLSFESDTTIVDLSKRLGGIGLEVKKQIGQRHIDMEQLQALLPDFSLKINGRDNNVIGKYLRARKITYKEIRLSAGSATDKGFHLFANIDRPSMGNISFDSITLRMDQQQERLDYNLGVMNPTGIVKDLYNVRLFGSVQGNEIQLSVLQKNKEEKTGMEIGMKVTLQDSAIAVTLFPEQPFLGYGQWRVNKDNYIIFYSDHRIEADLQLGYQERFLKLRSAEKDGGEQLQLQMGGIDLSAVFNAIPFVPDLKGTLNADIFLNLLNDHLMAEGNLDIQEFYYKEQRIGTVGLDLNYDAANKFTNHTVDFAIHLDQLKRVIAQGEFSTSPGSRTIEVDVDIPSLPLYLVNAFVPEKLVKLDGELQGKIELRGNLDMPDLNGGLSFRQGQIAITMLGTTFTIDSLLIPIRQGQIAFNNFGITAPNRSRMEINGNVYLTPFSGMRTDLVVKASNFQMVNVKENSASLVYGKAYIDVNMAVQGPFSALNLTGNVNLLNNTVLDYVLRNADPELKDRTVDLVRFVSFQDSTLTAQDDLTNRVNTGNFSMKLFVEIGNAVSMNINLSEDGNNRVSIQGGGNLIFSITPESGNNLVGKYTLSGGMVRYNVPVVGEKNFSIKSGSYVEWTGNLANPLLNITASEALRVSVTEDNQSSRLVNFEAMVKIENNLEHPQITFDLAATNDQAIQSQLNAFSQEERTKQALNLLIYGTYSGPGTTDVGGNANNTLNNFVEKELNQWTRKYLKNSGLTFGINTYNQIGADGQEVKRTDYSYQFSKQLFNDKINVKIGGRISSDNDPGTSMEENLIDDIAIEYMLTKKRDLFLKVFRHTNYESVLEGEVTQTGVGVVWRKSFRKVKDLFIRKKKRLEREKNLIEQTKQEHL